MVLGATFAGIVGRSGTGIPLALPVLATPVVSDNANSTTLATASFAATTGDFLVVATHHRDSSSPSHLIAANGFTCTFTERGVANIAGNNNIRTTVFTGVVAAGGMGTIDLTTSSAAFQKAIVPLRVPGGSLFNVKGDDAATTAGLTVTADATPNAAALSLAFYAQESTEDAIVLPTGHADNVSAGGSVWNLMWRFGSKLGLPPSSWTFSGGDAGEAKAGVCVTVL